MKVLYVRVSTIEQNTDRQKVSVSEFDFVVEDKCSGAIPFNLRPGGLQLMEMLHKGLITSLHVWQIDRIGRDVRDIINTIHFFSEKRICIFFISQGLRTLDDNGKENPIGKMIINILGVVAEMERNQIRERQIQGIEIAKARGVYKGRRLGTREDRLTFLSKPQNKRAVELIKKGYKGSEVAKICDLHPNTVSKVKKLMGRPPH
jgi:DNA invertase Pin-like site-specific DNA recombinase